MNKAYIIKLQEFLRVKPDGDMGITTLTAFYKQCGASDKRAMILAQAANVYLRQFGILDNHLEFIHFHAQAVHETGGFKWLEELGSGEVYENREDLGNVEKGDGARFKGRGIFQITGRDNYILYSKRTGIDIMTDPSRASMADISIIIACHYWKNKGLGELARNGNTTRITYKINGGDTHLAERKAQVTKIASWFGLAA